MSVESFHDDAEHALADLRQRQEALAAATAAAAATVLTHTSEDGQIRVSVNGRMRIEELYVSERTLRSPDAEQQLLLAVNETIAAAGSAYAHQLAAGLDQQTAAMVTAAGSQAAPPGDGDVGDQAGRRRAGEDW